MDAKDVKVEKDGATVFSRLFKVDVSKNIEKKSPNLIVLDSL